MKVACDMCAKLKAESDINELARTVNTHVMIPAVAIMRITLK